MNSTPVNQLNPLHFPLKGSQLIEASAGTGKTFTLALLYVRLILGQNKHGKGFVRPLTPREILVVTFTNLAAGELRDRIRARLVEAAQYFQNSALDSDAFLTKLREQYEEEQWPHCAFRLEMAAESMDEAAISTIHSWCNRILVEHSFNTRGLFNRELVTDTSELFTEVVQDYWRSRFYPLNDSQAQLLLGAINSYGNLEATLKQLIRPSVHGISLAGSPLKSSENALPDALAKAHARQQELVAKEQTLKEEWEQHWHSIVAELNALRPHLNGSTYRNSKNQDKFDELLVQVRAWINGIGELPNEIMKFRLGEFKFNNNAPREEEPLPVFSLTKALHELQQQPPIPLAAFVFSDAMHWVATTFQQRLNELTQLRHDDLLLQLNQALDPNHAQEHAATLADTLKSSFPVALIDEFQDTDPIQFEIFDRIYDVHNNHQDSGIFMIGDPKQSIYAFRGADINVYLAARKATEGRHHTLRKNFRSTTGVVNACNTLFLHAESHEKGAFQYQHEGYNPIPYVEVGAMGRSNQLLLNQQPCHPMTFWYFNNPDAPTKPISIGKFRELAAATAASQVAQWLNQAAQGTTGFGNGNVEQPLAPADIAILVRNYTEAELITNALAERNIASVYLSERQQLFASQEAQDMLHWLRAVAEPQQESLLKAALGTTTMGLPMATYMQWQNDELAWEKEVVTFSQLHNLWQRQGPLVMLQRLLETYDLPARLLNLSGNTGERSLTNLLHLAEWLQRAASHIDGQQALIRHLREHLNSHNEENILRLESDAQRVKIITIHKSKGLEYPLVLLPFISAFSHIGGRNKDVSIHIDGQRYVDLDANHMVYAEANDARLKEDLRLLYVALTRASYGLWLGVAPIGTTTNLTTERSALGYVLHGSQAPANVAMHREAAEQLANGNTIACIDAPAATLEQAPQQSHANLTDARPAPAALRHLPSWWIASYSALLTGASSALSPETARDEQRLEQLHSDTTAETIDDTPSPKLMHQFPRGPRWGTFLHNVLEWAAIAEDSTGQRGFAIAAAQDAQRLAFLHNRCELNNIAEHASALSLWLKSFLQQRWHNTGLALADLRPQQYAVELEFLFASHQVNTQALDQLVRQHTLEGTPAPELQHNTVNGMLKGFIDLVAEHNGQYYVVDWKSNALGNNDAAYTEAAMHAAVAQHRYDLQYCLYLLALHRLLKARLKGYCYDTHVGGAIYVFLRGTEHPESQGLYQRKPPFALIEALDNMFAARTQEATNA